jgi:LysM repeat protein
MFCKTLPLAYNAGMKTVVPALGHVALLLMTLSGCRFPGTQAPNVGPFDKNGNYVEAWADDPSKWRSYTPKDVDRDPPQIAKNEQPPDHSIPLEAGSPPVTKPQVSGTRSGGEHTVVKNSPKSKTRSARDETPKSKTSVATTKSGAGKTKSSTAKTKSSVAKTKSSVASSKPTRTTRHTVKSGDSLSSIASRYGTSVSALKSANGISGTMIRDGKSLVIPRRK